MSLRWKATLVAVTIGMFMGGCAVAARIGGLQPPPVKSRVSVTLPQAVKAGKGRMQLGIAVDWYTWPKEDVTLRAAETVAYIDSLHANAISISFPFFVYGTSSNTVHATRQTPTPAQLSILIRTARRFHMTVSLRPLLASGVLGRGRNGWKPDNEAVFFKSYEQFLRPYLILAQREGVTEFIEGAELSAFDTAPGWRSLSNWARSLYGGTLACAANWSNELARSPAPICGGVTKTVDAYPPITSGSLLAGWKHFDETLPPGTALTEVGIAAAPKAPTHPSQYSWAEQKPDPKVQADWFSAACHAAQREHLRGIYFWSIGMGTPAYGPTVHHQARWTGSAGAGAIADCFAEIERAWR